MLSWQRKRSETIQREEGAFPLACGKFDVTASPVDADHVIVASKTGNRLSQFYEAIVATGASAHVAHMATPEAAIVHKSATDRPHFSGIEPVSHLVSPWPCRLR